MWPKQALNNLIYIHPFNEPPAVDKCHVRLNPGSNHFLCRSKFFCMRTTSL